MIQRKFSNLDLKSRLIREFIQCEGYKKIYDVILLKDIENLRFDKYGILVEETITTRLNAFMIGLIHNENRPPLYDLKQISMFSSFVQKGNFFEQIQIDNTEDFDKIYDKYKSKSDFLFRGQSEAKWRLYSTLQRKWIEINLASKVLSYKEFIQKLVTNGTLIYGEKIKDFLAEKHIDTINPISILGFLQHYRCPTPLLDWTYSFGNALYFALDGLKENISPIEIENYVSVYYIEEEEFKDGNILEFWEERIAEFEREALLKIIENLGNNDKGLKDSIINKFNGSNIIDAKKINGSGFIFNMIDVNKLFEMFPLGYFTESKKEFGVKINLNNNLNILNQQGAFTWNAHPIKPLEMIGFENFETSNEEITDYRFCRCFNINKSLAEHIKQRLLNDGITKDLIYPKPEIQAWDVFEKNISDYK